MNKKREIFTGTFIEVEQDHLREGIRSSTRKKIEFFEDMLEFAWEVGAIKEASDITSLKNKMISKPPPKD